MEKIKIEVEVAKDLYEVVLLLADVVKGLKSGKPLADIAVAELAALKNAVDGIQNVPEGLKDEVAASLRAALIPLSDVLESFLVKKPVA